MKTDKKITYETIWANLGSIDTKDKVEKKMKFSYLSWAWAWGELMKIYPDATYDFYEQAETGVPYVKYPDNTCEVRCRVKIGECVREMWLPVMNSSMQAITNPNSRQVSDTKMRCLVKCLAMFGLGHNIFAGEDLPSVEKDELDKKDADKKAKNKESKSNKTVDWKQDDRPVAGKMYADTFMQTLKQFHVTPDECRKYWSSNSADLQHLKSKHESIYNDLVIKMKEYVQTLENQEGGKDGE